MKNKLVSDEQRIDYEKLTSKKYPEHRRSGRSTGIAIYCIGQAMINPGQWVRVRNHDSHGYNRNDVYLIDTICDMVNTLNLNYFMMNKNNCSIMYDIFERDKSEYNDNKYWVDSPLQETLVAWYRPGYDIKEEKYGLLEYPDFDPVSIKESIYNDVEYFDPVSIQKRLKSITKGIKTFNHIEEAFNHIEEALNA